MEASQIEEKGFHALHPGLAMMHHRLPILDGV